MCSGAIQTTAAADHTGKDTKPIHTITFKVYHPTSAVVKNPYPQQH